MIDYLYNKNIISCVYACLIISLSIIYIFIKYLEYVI